MASIRKRTWFTAADLKKIKPAAERLAKAAGKDDWLVYRDEAATTLEIKPKEGWLVAYIDQSKKRRFKAFETKTAAKNWSVTACTKFSRASIRQTLNHLFCWCRVGCQLILRGYHSRKSIATGACHALAGVMTRRTRPDASVSA